MRTAGRPRLLWSPDEKQHLHHVSCTITGKLKEIYTDTLNIQAVRVVYLVDEAGLAHVGVTAQEEGPRVWVDARQPGQMLAHWQEEALPSHFNSQNPNPKDCKTVKNLKHIYIYLARDTPDLTSASSGWCTYDPEQLSSAVYTDTENLRTSSDARSL